MIAVISSVIANVLHNLILFIFLSAWLKSLYPAIIFEPFPKYKGIEITINKIAHNNNGIRISIIDSVKNLV